MTDWLLVPREPTEGMIKPLDNHMRPAAAKEMFHLIVDASPKKEPIIWYNTFNSNVEYNHKEWMDDYWIPLYYLKD
jgi:hypothetical protein